MHACRFINKVLLIMPYRITILLSCHFDRSEKPFAWQDEDFSSLRSSKLQEYGCFPKIDTLAGNFSRKKAFSQMNSANHPKEPVFKYDCPDAPVPFRQL